MPGKWLFFRKDAFRDENPRFSWDSRAAHFARIQGALAYTFDAAAGSRVLGVIFCKKMSSFFHFFVSKKVEKALIF